MNELTFTLLMRTLILHRDKQQTKSKSTCNLETTRATVANTRNTTPVSEREAHLLYKSSINELGVINKYIVLIYLSARQDAVSLLASVRVSAEV